METMTNAQMAHYLDLCEQHVDHTGLLGYACARNSRMLMNACKEFIITRDKLLKQYGTPELDDEGNETGRVTISQGSNHWDDLLAELNPIESIEHEVEIMKVEAEDVMDQLTGREMLELEFMIEGWD